jgi:hypothetical protein
MQFQVLPAGIALGLATIACAQGRVIITEIMYNPASNERGGATEWVEIANVGDEEVVLTDYKLDDEDRGSWGAFSCTLAPGGVAVLVNQRVVDEETFRAAWDVPQSDAEGSTPPPVYQLIPVSWGGLANRPDADNEILQLLDAEGKVVCEVNIQTGDEWPDCSGAGGASIHLVDLSATAFNVGKLWKLSEADKDGAHACTPNDVFDKPDVGSPGFVPGLTSKGVKPAPPPEPASDKPADDPEDSEESEDDTIDY